MKPNEIITQRFIELLEKGVTPWKKTWNSNQRDFAKNIISNKEYQGINFFMTNFSDYESEKWGTFKQIKSIGGKVKKGEKGTPIVFYSIMEKEQEEKEEKKTIPFLRMSYVFNIEQCEGLENEKTEVETFEHDPIDRCENIINSFPVTFPEVRHEKQSAFYSPSLDYINLPEKSLFPKVEEYYSTYFHEAIHATGHKMRLDREGVSGISYFGDSTYSKEELIAELGSAFLCAKAGIDDETQNQSASYLYGWIKVLKENPKILLQSSSQAQKAVDYLLDTKKDG